MNVVDCFFLVAGVFGAIKGFLKGFVHSLLSSFKYIMAFLFCREWCQEVSIWLLKRWELDIKFFNLFKDIYPVPAGINKLDPGIRGSARLIMPAIKAYLREMDLPLNLNTILLKNINTLDVQKILDDLSASQLEKFEDVLIWIASSALARLICYLLAILLIFIVTILIVSVLIWFVDQFVFRMTDMKYFNRVAGVMWGFIFYVFILYLIIQFMAPFLSSFSLDLEHSRFYYFASKVVPLEFVSDFHRGWGAD